MTSKPCQGSWLILGLTLILIHLATTQGKKPNILFILADDYGFHDIGYHGSEFYTPNLDQLAADGVKLENYYVQHICSPTRSQLMTGRYQIHTGLQHNIIWPSQPYGVPLEDRTIANVLKDNGFSTHIVGKWHLGFYKKEYTPLYRGFDTFYGFYEGGETYFTYENCDYVHNKSIDAPAEHDVTDSRTADQIEADWIERERSEEEQQRKFDWCGYDLRDMDKPVTDMNGTYSTHLYTRKAINVIKNAEKSDKPFFLYLSYQAPHEPMEVPESYVKPYAHIENKIRRTYAGMVSALDEGVGQVIDTLRESGQMDNTIIIFSTDNGGWVKGGGINWPLRGGKATLWEGGLRGIGFVTSPLLEKPGRISHQLMHVSDWFPTITDMVGARQNKSLNLDGVNQWPMISKGEPSARKEILHNIDPLIKPKGQRLSPNTFDNRIQAAIRVGDYKLITGMPGYDSWLPVPCSKKNIEPSSTAETLEWGKNLWLFNIAKDPYEMMDLSDKMPHKVYELLDRLEFYNSTAVEPNYPPSDPKCDPKLHGGFWSVWE